MRTGKPNTNRICAAFLISLTFILGSCNDHCVLNEIEAERKVDIRLNPKAKKALDNLSDLFQGGQHTYGSEVDQETGEIFDIMRSTSLYFTFDQNEKSLLFHYVFYYDNSKMKLDKYAELYYKLPLEKINAEDIEVVNLYTNSKRAGHFISIPSWYNEDDAFKTSLKNYRKELNQCKTSSTVQIALELGDGEKFKSELSNLINNI